VRLTTTNLQTPISLDGRIAHAKVSVAAVDVSTPRNSRAASGPVSFRRKAGAKKETAPLRQGAVDEIAGKWRWRRMLKSSSSTSSFCVNSAAREGDCIHLSRGVDGPAGTDSGTLARGQ
jgi:hypothetical protein